MKNKITLIGFIKKKKHNVEVKKKSNNKFKVLKS